MPCRMTAGSFIFYDSRLLGPRGCTSLPRSALGDNRGRLPFLSCYQRSENRSRAPLSSLLKTNRLVKKSICYVLVSQIRQRTHCVRRLRLRNSNLSPSSDLPPIVEGPRWATGAFLTNLNRHPIQFLGSSFSLLLKFKFLSSTFS
jgi:hypothetical protein